MFSVLAHHRNRSWLAAALIAALGIASMWVAGGWSRAQAATTPSGYGYKAVLTLPDNSTLTLRRITRAAVNSDQASIFRQLTTSELSDAKTSLGDKSPGSGFTIIKSFDSADRAQQFANLAGHPLARATLTIAYNGTVVQQLALAPAYVSSVTESSPKAGTTTAIRETIKILGTAVTRPASGTPPPATKINPAGYTYVVSLTTGGKTWALHQITGASLANDPKTVENDVSPEHLTDATNKLGATPTVTIRIVNQLTKADLLFFKTDRTTATLSSFALKVYFNSKLLRTWTVQSAYIASWSQSYNDGGKTGPITNTIEITFAKSGFSDS